MGKTLDDLNKEIDEAKFDGFVDFLGPDRVYLEGDFNLEQLEYVVDLLKSLHRSNMN